MTADLVDTGGAVRSLRLEDGTQLPLIHHRSGAVHEISVGGATLEIEIVDPLALKRRRREDESAGGGAIKALMPGRVVRIMVKAGDVVKKGSALLILEAMKMENEIQSPVNGTIETIFVEAGATVEGGADLVRIV
jgi:biotin carboxyl carrier protein